MGIFKVVRDAITGRFVRKEEAKERPASTVTETVRRRTAGDVLRDGKRKKSEQ